MKIIEGLIQNTPEWHEFRSKHIGASEISSVMTTNPWKSAYALWMEKTGRSEPKKPNKAMERGSFLETEALHTFISQAERFYRPVVAEYSKWDIASASFDGMSDDEEYIVEIKCPSEKSYCNMLDNGIPEHYRDQMQWQLMVDSKAEKCSFFVYRDQILNFSYEVFQDKEHQKHLLEKAKEFWKMIENDIPPAMTDRDYLERDDDEFLDVAFAYYEKASKIKELELQIKPFKARLIELTGGRNTKGAGVTIRASKGRQKTNMELLRSDYDIDDKTFAKYQECGKDYVTITLNS